MKQAIYTLSIIFIIGLLVGCNPYSEDTMVEPEEIKQEEIKPVDKVVEPKEEIKEEPKVEQKPIEQKPVEKPVEQPKQELDAEVAELIQKNIDSTNFGYAFESSYADSGGFLKTNAGYGVYKAKDKIKKVVPNLIRVKNISYNEIYLDETAKTAYGVCLLSRARCEKNYQIAYKLDYEKEKIDTTPIDVLKAIPNDAKITGDEMFDNRKVTKIEYENKDGKIERLYIDSYYGIPMRQSVFKIVNGEDSKLSENTFTRLVVGNIKTSEVTMPSDLVISDAPLPK